MADLKISQLNSAATLTGSEQLAAVQSGATVKATVDNLKSYLTPCKSQSKSGAYTAVAADLATVLLCTGSFTLSFTAAATLGNGWWLWVINSGSGTITLDPNGTELIYLPGDTSGRQTVALPYAGTTAGPYLVNGLLLQCDGSGFRVLESSIALPGDYAGTLNPLALAHGGTGATTAANGRTNLGLGSIATQAASAVAITGGSISGITDLALADGGTGASDAATARTNLGLGSIATQAASAVAITGGSITGITDLALADGGTGASDAATARTNLGAAPLASPTFTGTPAAPTAAGGTNTTQVATTAFVQNTISWKTQSKSTAYTATSADLATALLCTGSFTLSFTAAATLGNGWWLWVINSGSGSITLDPNGTELIYLPGDTSGRQTVALPYAGTTAGPYLVNGLLLQCDGTGFRVLDASIALPGDYAGTLNPLALAHGGTGATTAANGRTNLGLGSIAIQPASAVAITGGSITGITDLALADGGTGASDAATARTNLGAAPLASPALTGTPTAPTATSGTSSTQIATTAFVQDAVAYGVSWGTQSKSSAYTADTNDLSTVLACSGTFTLSFVSAASLGDSWWVWVKNTGTGTITLDPNGTELIYMPGDATGQQTVTLPYTGKTTAGPYVISGLLLQCNGTGFQVIDTDIALPGDYPWTLNPLALAHGGTGATTAANARTNLGLGTIATQAADSVSITGGSITGITDLALADGGTGASDAATARTNLGLGSIATQAANSVSITGGSITGITDLALADGGTGASDAATARTNLGLGSIATQAANSVSITGGSITGITDLAVADGGTGSSTASGALTNLGAAPLASPAFTGTPTAPTAANGTNTTQIATTAFVLANGGSGGGDALTISDKTANYTVVSGDRGTIVQLTPQANSAYTISLTAAATLGAGFHCWITHASTGYVTATVIIDPNGSETIDNVATITLYRGEQAFILCDGSNWRTNSLSRFLAQNFVATQTRSIATGSGAVALGPGASASVTNAIAIGASASAGGSVGTIAIGGVSATGDYSVAIGGIWGAQTTVANTASISIGNSCAASGNYSTAVGAYCTASGGNAVAIGYTAAAPNNSIAIGSTVTATPSGCVAIGLSGKALRIGEMAYSSGSWTTAGDRQLSNLLLYATTTDATTTTLTANGSAASSTNVVNLLNNSSMTFAGKAIAQRKGSEDTTSTAGWTFNGVLRRGANAASTTLVAAVVPTVIAADSNANTWTLTVTADTTNGGLNIAATGEAAKNIRWLCTINATTITYA